MNYRILIEKLRIEKLEDEFLREDLRASGQVEFSQRRDSLVKPVMKVGDLEVFCLAEFE